MQVALPKLRRIDGANPIFTALGYDDQMNKLMPTGGLIAALLLSPTLSAKPERYEIDPVHTRIVFFIEHMGLSQSIGTFSGPTGYIIYDDEKPEDAQVSAHVPIASLDFGNTEWNEHILGGKWLDQSAHAEASFTSTQVNVTEANQLIVEGTFCLRGVCLPQTIEVTLNAQKRNPMNFKKMIGFSGKTRIDRSQFGIDSYLNMVGAEVTVMIEVEAVRSGSADQDDTAEAGAKTP